MAYVSNLTPSQVPQRYEPLYPAAVSRIAGLSFGIAETMMKSSEVATRMCDPNKLQNGLSLENDYDDLGRVFNKKYSLLKLWGNRYPNLLPQLAISNGRLSQVSRHSHIEVQ